MIASTKHAVGPEKLLEVWFSESSTSLPSGAASNGLKTVSSAEWKDMLDLVNCKVLSVIESEHVDAYLLSESSMFIFPHKLILKTCGTTTLLSGLPRILEIAAVSAGFPHTVGDLVMGIATAARPYRVFYSRKNFLFPDRQRGPHRSWRDEVKSLDRLFLGGSAYMIGKMNGDHWYLYLTEPNTVLTPSTTPDGAVTETKILELPASRIAASTKSCSSSADDETLEILMTDLDVEDAKQFYLDHASAVAKGDYYQRMQKTRHDSVGKACPGGFCHQGHRPSYLDAVDIFSNTSSDNDELPSSGYEDGLPVEYTTEGHALGTVVSERSGLSDVYPTGKYPGARVDAYLFTPCGFSANGVVPASRRANETHYFTVHVTPEPHCSYASFETNVPSGELGPETANVVEQVVRIFNPGRFSVTLFETKPLADVDAEAATLLHRPAVPKRAKLDCIPGYRRVDRIVHDLEGYDLVFRYYERWDWKGGAPRLGEPSM